MSIDLTSMSRAELVQLKSDVEKAIVAAESRERKDALKAAQDAAAQYGFSLEDLAGGKPAAGKRSKSGPKYRNPENPTQTWSGLGRKPNWVHAALAEGRDMAELEI